jgi:hypothetical protein
MYSNQNFGAGAVWSFMLVVLVAALAWSNGGLLGDAKWLNTDIASAEADQKKMQTAIAQTEAELALRIKEAETAAEIERLQMEAQAKIMAIKQDMQAKIVAEQQWAEFRQNLFSTLNTSLMLFTIAASIAFAAWAISKNVIAYKMSIIQANIRYQREIQIANARQLERDARKKELQEKKTKKPTPIETLYTRPFWPDDDKQNHPKRKNYPLAN